MAEKINKVKTYDGELHDLEVDLSEYYTKSESDALLNGKVDTSSMDAYYTKVEDNELLSGKADKDTTYTKVQTDSLLLDKADKANTYTDAEVDALLGTKANSTDVYVKSDVYTKAETDTLLGGKADTGVSYTKAEDDALLGAKADASSVYTKTETDGLLGAKADTSEVNSELASMSSAQSEVDSQQNANISSLATASSETADGMNSLATATSEVVADMGSMSTAQSEVDSQLSNSFSSLSTAESELGSELTVFKSETAEDFSECAKVASTNNYTGGNQYVVGNNIVAKSTNVDRNDPPQNVTAGNARVMFQDNVGTIADITLLENTDGSFDLNIGPRNDVNPNGGVVINSQWYGKAIDVVADGVKTWTQLLGEIATQADGSKISYKSKIVLYHGGLYVVMHCVNYGSVCRFIETNDSSQHIMFTRVDFVVGSATGARMGQGVNTFAITDKSYDVVANGTHINLVY